MQWSWDQGSNCKAGSRDDFVAGLPIGGGLSLHPRQNLDLDWKGGLLTLTGKEFANRLNECLKEFIKAIVVMSV